MLNSNNTWPLPSEKHTLFFTTRAKVTRKGYYNIHLLDILCKNHNFRRKNLFFLHFPLYFAHVCMWAKILIPILSFLSERLYGFFVKLVVFMN